MGFSGLGFRAVAMHFQGFSPLPFPPPCTLWRSLCVSEHGLNICKALVGLPKGSIYTTIVALGPKNHNMNGLLVPNSILVVHMDPLV